MGDRADAVRAAYAAFRSDPDQIWALCADGVVLHIAGEHPLSGDYVGVEAARGYVAAMREATNGRGGFTVTSVFNDDSGDLLLVEGTAFHGDEPFVRTVVHLLRFDGPCLVEFWENPFDQRAEDRFWCDHIPEQRRPASPSVSTGVSPAVSTAAGSTRSTPGRIPAQHTPPLSSTR
jgi:ketosteroid isomerase-like protein